ncbi:hypothetical protein F4827_001692 [Paraburkholderia bannensis]|uniref:Uncharacterized protein n=1 Tax=Paraburkholderia bannensis TaxID=765414 RepID=A0A7W9TVG6_9BURK|nr:hypothetical protein [Paraburkholderia bannensis]MBB3256846.1 hypothetical protein [Paraburkholderia sp. WP4_3_2]MBB6101844.1 hypothetical protein [Paraburkholderia bannensis]
MEEQENKLYMPVFDCLMWAKATLEVGNKLIVPKMVPRDESRINEHFFVISIMKLSNWCDVLQALDDRFSEPCKIISDVVTEDVKNVRDMREHDDEYLQGSGRRKDKFMFQAEDFSSDASATIARDGEYLIGGRVHVQKLMDAAGRFTAAVEALLEDVGLGWMKKR